MERTDGPVRQVSLRSAWRSEYHQHRYLEHGSDEQLKERQRDIFQNSFSFDAEGVFDMPSDRSPWDRLMAHVYSEAELRKLELDPVLRVSGYHHVKRAAELWSMYYGSPQPPCLFKFGRRLHLEQLQCYGQFRLSPASKYCDALNPAIRDTELLFTEYCYGAKFLAPENGDYTTPVQQWTPLPVLGNVCHQLQAEADYYTFCFSNRYDYRLFDDFGADACLVIRDPGRFVGQVRTGMAHVLRGW